MEPTLETFHKIITEVKSKKFLTDFSQDLKKKDKKEFKKIRKQIENPKSKSLY